MPRSSELLRLKYDYDLLNQSINRLVEKTKVIEEKRDKKLRICSHSNVVEENDIKICENCGIELSSDTFFDKNWKFGDVWLVLNQEQLVHVVTAIANHVQSAYDWEKSVIDAIDAANDLVTLDAIVTVK